MTVATPRLVVFAGLPGTGKSTLARPLAQQLGAAYLRVDTIEAELLNLGRPAQVEGYAVAYRLAEDNLHLGLSVVADCVNPLPVTRDAWQQVAGRAQAHLVNVEVVCSDAREHRRRVEARHKEGGTEGLWRPPTWEEVQASACVYQPWTAPRLVLETAWDISPGPLVRLLAELP